MAFRNAVKATLLSEQEEQSLRLDEPRPLFDAPLPPLSAQQVPEKDRPAPLVAKAPSEIAPPRAAAGEAFLGATWHARAEALCAMADALPSKVSWSLISKIAGLYDEIARDAGWSEAASAPTLDAPPRENAPPSEEAPPAEPSPPDRMAFPRRPLPSARPVPRRRA